MDEKTLRNVQLIQLEIAKEVKRICEKNKIVYWLDSGSLLGAVRHQGFIPWDDDLDIGMKRSDYNKFISIAQKELSSDYVFQDWNTDPNYGLSFAKIRKKGTVYIENKAQNSLAENGIYIDIFPYDLYGDSILKQGVPLKIIKLLMSNKAGIETWRENDSINIPKFLIHMPFKAMSYLFKRKFLIKMYNIISQKYNNHSLDYFFPQGISNYGKWIIPVAAMKEMIELPFEDTTFKVPKGYDEYLTHAYGDYMKLPPEDKRENRHQIIKVKF